MDYKELKERQKWPLKQKIDHSLFTIEVFLSRTKGNAYVAFSGGKDSSVLLDLVRMIDKEDVPAVFVNTGNEYPDNIRFVRHLRDDLGYNIEELHPKLSPREVWKTEGFPLVSKKVSYMIRLVGRSPNTETARRALDGSSPRYGIPEKYKYILKEPYKVSDRCCTILKKNPMHEYERRTGRHPIIGVMAAESRMRTEEYIRLGGCNTFAEGVGQVTKSLPLAIWTDDDIFAYVQYRNLELSEIYNKGARGTGCVGCAFGCQFRDDHRFELLYKLYPKYYEMIMNYTNNGIKYREAVRKMLQLSGKELPDESGEIPFEY